MVKHSDRMTLVAASLHPPKGSEAFEELQRRIDATNNDPKVQHALKKSWAVARSTLCAQMENGAGRDGDEILRYFMLDACNRFWTLGAWDSLPASFNVTADFLRYSPSKNFFRILEEVDHEFSLGDFLDFATSPKSHVDLSSVSEHIPENKIYHFTNVSPLEETTVGDTRTQRFVAASCSLVRHADEVSICLIAAQPIGAAGDVVRRMGSGNVRITPGKERIHEDVGSVPIEAVPLRGDRSWWKLVVLARMDLERSAFQVRYVLRDCGRSFDIITDDPGIWLDSRGEVIFSDWEKRAMAGSEDLKEYGALFELAQYCVLLPQFFQESAMRVRPRNVKTEFGVKIASLKFKKQVSSAQPESRISFRTIFEMNAETGVAPSLVATPSALRIERTGFWKTLAPGKEGVDKHGNSVMGKTWVSKELTWIEREPASDGLTIDRESSVSGPDPGQIYVMRSAAHPEDVFKIGLTRSGAIHRAEQLSTSTGVPDKFLVVQCWNVGDCVRAESKIHERLDAYRLTSHREFFKAPYSTIREIVERILGEESGSKAVGG